MQRNKRITECLTSCGAGALSEAYGITNNLITAAGRAASLTELLDVHRTAARLGIINANLDADPNGMFRTDDLTKMKGSEVFLGNIDGIWTTSLNVFETLKWEDQESYVLVMNQYRQHLLSNFRGIADRIGGALTEARKESQRPFLQSLFRKRVYPREIRTETKESLFSLAMGLTYPDITEIRELEKKCVSLSAGERLAQRMREGNIWEVSLPEPEKRTVPGVNYMNDRYKADSFRLDEMGRLEVTFCEAGGDDRFRVIFGTDEDGELKLTVSHEGEEDRQWKSEAERAQHTASVENYDRKFIKDTNWGSIEAYLLYDMEFMIKNGSKYVKGEFYKPEIVNNDMKEDKAIEVQEKTAETKELRPAPNPSVPSISVSTAEKLGEQHKRILMAARKDANETKLPRPLVLNGKGQPLPLEDGVSCSLLRECNEDWLPDMLTMDEIRLLGFEIAAPEVMTYEAKGVSRSDGVVRTNILFNISDTTFPDQDPELFERFRQMRNDEEEWVMKNIRKEMNAPHLQPSVLVEDFLAEKPQYKEYELYIRNVFNFCIKANTGAEALSDDFGMNKVPDAMTAYRLHRAAGTYLESRLSPLRPKEFASAAELIHSLKVTMETEKKDAMCRAINGPECEESLSRGIS